MKTRSKVFLVIGGYLAALGVTLAFVYVYIAVMDSPERRAPSGMTAFSDALLFLAVSAIVFYGGRGAESGSLLHAGSVYAVLRLLVAPLFALAFAISSAFARERTPRIALVTAAMLESTSFAAAALAWLSAFQAN